MKLLHFQAALGSAILLLSSPCEAKHHRQLSHLEVLEKRHTHKRAHSSPRVEGIEEEPRAGLKKRGQCTFPSGAGLVAVTPSSSNAGWAMSPDQSCTPGTYCPYACPPGKVMAQWNPAATSYTYPLSMDGGLYCDEKGSISKPFPDNEYCVDGTQTVSAVNNAGSTVAFCQTVLPGNEAMLIPTAVDSSAVLAVPGTSYWCQTAAHYYINAPGISTSDACIWGDGTKALGNWSPYVAGANTDSSGNTYVKIGWNPIYMDCDWAQTTPTFGVKITCSGSGCNGLPCSIDPSVNGVGGVSSSDQSSGAGSANFCVVTVPPGGSASIEIFNAGDSSSSSSGSKASSSSVKATPSPTPTPTPTPTSTPTSTATPTHTSKTEESTTQPQSSTLTSPSLISSSYATVTSSTGQPSLITLLASSSVNTSSASATSNSPHVFFENGTETTVSGTKVATATGSYTLSEGSNSTVASAIATAAKKSAASETMLSGSLFSLVVLFGIASYMF